MCYERYIGNLNFAFDVDNISDEEFDNSLDTFYIVVFREKI
jgi:hypothetical protein